MIELPITNGFYKSRSLPLSHQEGINWYVSIPEESALSGKVLFGTPGMTQLATSGTDHQVNRGSRIVAGIPYFVNGTDLYSLDRTVDVNGEETFATSVSLGTVTGTGRVSIADNGTQLMILVPGGSGFIYNVSTEVFATITDGDFTANGAPQHVVFIDGYFACTTNSKKWIISALNNGLAWDALDFGTAESDPDVIVAAVVVRNQIFIVGSITTEGFQDIGGSGFPFQRNNVFLDKGCSAAFTLINASGTFFMMGAGKDESPAFWQFTGNNYKKISTDAIDAVLATLTTAELAISFAWSYAQSGAYFVGFSIPNRSFVYDLVTGEWHERKSQLADSPEVWRVNSIVSGYNRILVGDAIDGRIGELDLDIYKEYSTDLIRTATMQPFSNMGKEIRIPILRLTMESGVGNANVENPKIGLSISKNGRTFEYERLRSIGEIGEYDRIIEWRKNGRYSRFVIFRFRLSDAVKPVIIKLEFK